MEDAILEYTKVLVALGAIALLILIAGWVWRDTQLREMSPLWVPAVMFGGIIGIVAWLIVRERHDKRETSTP